MLGLWLGLVLALGAIRLRDRIRIRVGCNSWVLQLGVRVRISG